MSFYKLFTLFPSVLFNFSVSILNQAAQESVLSSTDVLRFDDDNTSSSRRRNQFFNPSNSDIALEVRNGLETQKYVLQSSNLKNYSTQNGLENSAENVFLSEPEIEFDMRNRDDAFRVLSPKENPYALGIVLLHAGRREGCSGSLLTDVWVLTAAHCLRHNGHVIKGKAIVYAGGTYLGYVMRWLKTTRLPKHVQIAVSSEFYVNDQGLDIGLIRLPKKFKLTDYVNTIELLSKPWTHRGYRQCSTTAFGTVFGDEKDRDDYKRKTQKLEIKEPCLCSHWLHILDDSKLFTEDFLCAKPVKDSGVCFGDSGGGLVCNGKIVAVNIMILGFDNIQYCEYNRIEIFLKELFGIQDVTCGAKNTLNVFQATCRALPWINEYVHLFSSDEIEECAHIYSDGSQFFSHHPNILVVVFAYFIKKAYTHTF